MDIPLIYAILPVLPLFLLIIFSKYVHLFDPPIELDTTTAMFVSLAVSMLFELIRLRSFKAVFMTMKSFWEGMGKVFTNVVTLIVAAEIFSKGLISLGFIDALVEGDIAVATPAYHAAHITEWHVYESYKIRNLFAFLENSVASISEEVYYKLKFIE